MTNRSQESGARGQEEAKNRSFPASSPQSPAPISGFIEPGTWNLERFERGFTLLEAMVALAILSIALVGLLGLGNRSIGVNAELQRITQATLLAQQRMTEIEVEAAEGAIQLQNEEGAFEEPFSEYSWQVSYEDTPLPQVQMVSVVVAWGEEARNEMVELNSFVFR